MFIKLLLISLMVGQGELAQDQSRPGVKGDDDIFISSEPEPSEPPAPPNEISPQETGPANDSNSNGSSISEQPAAEPPVPNPDEGVPRLTNEGGEFKDPFSDTSPVSPPPAPANAPPEIQAPPQAPVEQPQVAPSPIPSIPSQKRFEFPDTSRDRTPVSQEIKLKEKREARTEPGTWHLGINIGAGVKANRRPNQIHFELTPGYRVIRNLDIVGVIYGRVLSDNLVGFLVGAKYFLRLSDSEQMRVELGLGGLLGWTLRAEESQFNEGRFTTRGVADLAIYPIPGLAMVPSIGLESFIFSRKDGATSSLSKGGGWPTQLLLLAGLRVEF